MTGLIDSEKGKRMNHILCVEPTRANLQPRSLFELHALCRVLAIPHTGNKAKRIDRILSAWDLRKILTDVKEPSNLTESFKAKELRQMCRTAGKFHGGNKRMSACVLINWRNECRRKGQERIAEAREYNAKMRMLRLWGPL